MRDLVTIQKQRLLYLSHAMSHKQSGPLSCTICTQSVVQETHSDVVLKK